MPYSLGDAASIFIPFLSKSACWCQVSHYTNIMWASRTSLAFPRTALLQGILGGLTGLGIGPNLSPAQAGYKSTTRRMCDSRAALGDCPAEAMLGVG